MGWINTELVLVTIAAMLSPTTLTFSTFVLVLSGRPLRAGFWFYLGALSATLAIGVLAAFVLGDAAASSHPSTPKTWVAVVDVVAAALILAWVARVLRRPRNPERTASMMEQIRGVADSRAIAILGAGATLANPGGFIPLALKEISELNPSAAGYVVEWLFFTLVSLLPLASALLLLLIAPAWTERMLERARAWLELHARTVAAVIVVLVALALLRNGIAGLTA
ncbi:MAG TPA: GAP family protein [Gaiellaceae bacterium]|nr:GAP family protein [Gaiellaceae bacterium]